MGKLKDPCEGLFSLQGFANPRRDFDRCHETVFRSLYSLSQKFIEITQYSIFLQI